MLPVSASASFCSEGCLENQIPIERLLSSEEKDERGAEIVMNPHQRRLQLSCSTPVKSRKFVLINADRALRCNFTWKNVEQTCSLQSPHLAQLIDFFFVLESSGNCRPVIHERAKRRRSRWSGAGTRDQKCTSRNFRLIRRLFFISFFLPFTHCATKRTNLLFSY